MIERERERERVRKRGRDRGNKWERQNEEERVREQLGIHKREIEKSRNQQSKEEICF